MTEDFEDGNYLVRVRAQVMTRDDSSGGWVPMGGGGLSNVSVRKRGVSADPSIAEDMKHEYLIFGKRISDQSVVLSCIIKKDFEYNKVMPTFHHWKTGDMKFGLTFQTAADARAFDKGVRTAVEELIEGIHGVIPYHNPDVADDDVFVTLNLPSERRGSRSSSESSDVRPITTEPENYSYVQLRGVHDYMYPVVEGKQTLPKQLPTKQNRCIHCQEHYSTEENVRGSCPNAPDEVKNCIERATCLGLARRVLHKEDPCDCSTGCGWAWIGLAFLSILVPCLLGYPALRACHMCGMGCGLCGGRHHPGS